MTKPTSTDNLLLTCSYCNQAEQNAVTFDLSHIVPAEWPLTQVFALPLPPSIPWVEFDFRRKPTTMATPIGEIELRGHGRLWHARRKCKGAQEFPDRMVVADTEPKLCEEMLRLAGIDQDSEGDQVRLDIDFTQPGASHHVALELEMLTGDTFEPDVTLTPLPTPALDPEPEDA